MHALAEAASGPVPPSALLPILRAKETGPAATDLTLEVLQRIIGEADEGGGGGSIRSNDTSKNAVIGENFLFCCRTPPGVVSGFRCWYGLKVRFGSSLIHGISERLANEGSAATFGLGHNRRCVLARCLA